MKYITLFILLLVIDHCSGQQWMQSMSKPDVNYFQVEREYLHWKDSMLHTTTPSFFDRFFRKEKLEIAEEVQEEAEEQFHNWASEFKQHMDEEGNALSQDEILERLQSYYKAIGGNRISQTQGTWIPRGPFTTPGNGLSRGLGRVFPIAVSNVDTNIIYASTPGSGMFKSFDEGATWFQIEDSLTRLSPPTSIHPDPQDVNIVYIKTNTGIYKSIDGGVTWASLITMLFSKFVIDPVNHQVLYAGSYHNGLYKSVDGGLNWTNISTLAVIDIAIKPFHSEVIYLLRNSDIFRSLDGGATFDSITTINTAYYVFELAVTPADSNYVYAFCGSNSMSVHAGQVAVSADGGSTFILNPVSSNIYCFNDMVHFAVSTTDKNVAAVGGIYLATTNDGGLSFNAPFGSAFPSPHVDNRSIQFVGTSLWTGNDGGIYKILNGAVGYIDKTNGLNVAQFNSLSCSESDTSVFAAGANDNSIVIHTDSGWSNIFHGDGYDVAINPADPLMIFGKDQYGFNRTFDGGVTSQIQNGSFFSGITESSYAYSAGFPVRFSHQNPHSVYHLVSNVWKGTNNNGDAVTNISNFTSLTGGGKLFVCDIDSNIIYTPFHKTFDGGLTWSDFPLGIATADPDEPNKVWTTQTNHGIQSVYFSNDTGNTWQMIPSLDINPLSIRTIICANNSTDGIFLVAQNIIYYYDNTLSNWQPFNKDLPNVRVTDLQVIPAVGKVRISTFGRGIWESNLFDPSQTLAVDFITNKTSICPGQEIQFYDNSLNNGPGYNPTYQWSFPGGTPSTSGSGSPLVYYGTPGIYSVSLHIINSNGNDSITKSQLISVSAPPLVSIPLTEDFESGVFPPTGWDWNQPRVNRNWNLSPSFGGYATSINSLFYRTWTNIRSDEDYFLSPFFDFSSIPDPAIIFDYCYPYDYVDADTFKLFYTTDCGETKDYFFAKGGLDLKTDSTRTNYGFTPIATSWRTDTISLTALATLGDVQLGFEMLSNTRCEMYIDNINISSVPLSGIENLFSQEKDFTISPNPANDHVRILWKSDLHEVAELSVRNFLGQIVYFGNVKSNEAVQFSTESFADGVYFIRLHSANFDSYKKTIVQKR